MSLGAITDRDGIRSAYGHLLTKWQQGAERHSCDLGYHGGLNRGCDLYWRADLHMWLHLSDQQTQTRYWCCFGTAEPTGRGSLSITCELNAPFEGVNLRIGGMFARDEGGAIYLLHSGKIGGGKPGIGKTEFREFMCNGNAARESVALPGRRRPVDMFVVGRVDGEHLPAHIAHFVRQAERFKSGRHATAARLAQVADAGTFTPEFAGRRRPYAVNGPVESQCDHGVVVGALERALSSLGMACGNDRQRDLFVAANGRVRVLFEVKTDTTTGCVYEAVGQLMLHGAAQDKPPIRIMVLPDEPNKATMQALNRIGVRCLLYEWVDGNVVFRGLEDACGE